MNETIAQPTLTRQILALGVDPGGVLLVHCAFSRVRPVEGGPAGLIAALRDALGPGSTLVMPSMTDEDDTLRSAPDALPRHGRSRQYLLADAGRPAQRQPHAFAAVGPQAAAITAPHPPDVPHGLDSPVGRGLRTGRAGVLLLGIDHTANTTILAEYLGGVRYRRKKYLTLNENGQHLRFDYAGSTTAARTSTWWMAGSINAICKTHGIVGHAPAPVDALARCGRNGNPAHPRGRAVFLRPPEMDEECDEPNNT